MEGEAAVPHGGGDGGVAPSEVLKALGQGLDEVPMSSGVFQDFEEAIKTHLAIEEVYKQPRFSQVSVSQVKPCVDRLMGIVKAMAATCLRLERRNAVLEAKMVDQPSVDERWSKLSERLDRLESGIQVAASAGSREIQGDPAGCRPVSYPIPVPGKSDCSRTWCGASLYMVADSVFFMAKPDPSGPN